MNGTAQEIQDWIADYLSKLLQVDRNDVDVTSPFERFGLDSAAVVGMTGDLSDAFGIEIDPTLAYDHPTIERFSRELATQLAARAEAAAKALA